MLNPYECMSRRELGNENGQRGESARMNRKRNTVNELCALAQLKEVKMVKLDIVSRILEGKY